MMLRNLWMIIALFVCTNCFGQIQFHNGYFIDQSGKTTSCLIKKMLWDVSPEKFYYKLDSDADTKTLTAKKVKEFGINRGQKFYSFLLLADLTGAGIRKINLEKKPAFKQVVLFLTPIIIGEVSLYEYTYNGGSIFFVRSGNDIPRQLISKPYYKKGSKSKSIYYNKSYINTLWKDFNCGSITSEDISNIGYNREDLTKFFKSYNKCKQFKEEDVSVKKEQKFGPLSFSIRPGIAFVSTFSDDIFETDSYANFGTTLAGRLGLEVEFFQNNKTWSVFAEASYQRYKAETIIETKQSPIGQAITLVNMKIDYSTVEFPVGLRYYFYPTDKLSVFISGGAKLFEVDLEGRIYSENSSFFDLAITTGPNFFVSGGLQLNEKIRLDFKYDFRRDIGKQIINKSGIYEAFSIIGGYTF